MSNIAFPNNSQDILFGLPVQTVHSILPATLTFGQGVMYTEILMIRFGVCHADTL